MNHVMGRWWTSEIEPGARVTVPPEFDSSRDQIVRLPRAAERLPNDLVHIYRWEGECTRLRWSDLPEEIRHSDPRKLIGKRLNSTVGPVVALAVQYEWGALLVAKAKWPWILWRFWEPLRRVGAFLRAWYRINRHFLKGGRRRV